MSARWLAWALCASTLLATSGCSDDEKRECAAIYFPAATVVVVDEAGAVVGDAHVTYSYDDKQAQEATCAPRTGKSCTQWLITGTSGPQNQAGTYVIMATSADGKLSATQTVVVSGTACSPITQHVTLTLK